MNITLTTKLENISSETKEYALEKASKLEKFHRLRKIEVIMDMEGENYTVQIVAYPDRGGSPIAGASNAQEWLSAIDSANDKVERQLRKLKEKVKSHRFKKYKGESEPYSREDEETYDDAIDQM